MLNVLEQAKQETVEKVCTIVRKQLALPDDSAVTGESKFAVLGADSLDTVNSIFVKMLLTIFFILHCLSSYKHAAFVC